MSAKINILISVLLFVCWLSADGQYRRTRTYELHGGVGAVNVFGDLGGSADRNNWYGLKDIQFSQTRPLFYAGVRTDINEMFSGKVNLLGGMAAGNDKGSVNDVREFSYKAWMFELSGQIEWNFWTSNTSIATVLARRRGLGSRQLRTRAYVFAGAGYVYALPKLDTHGHTLIPDGEFTESHAGGVVVPYGVGIRSDVSQSWALGFEIGRRYCTSDYLDALSTQWSESKDTYYFTTLHAIYKLTFVGGTRRANRRF